jgi:hypothetical protein
MFLAVRDKFNKKLARGQFYYHDTSLRMQMEAHN